MAPLSWISPKMSSTDGSPNSSTAPPVASIGYSSDSTENLNARIRAQISKYKLCIDLSLFPGSLTTLSYFSDVCLHLPPPQDRGRERQGVDHEQDQDHPRRCQLQRGSIPTLQGICHLGDRPGNIRKEFQQFQQFYVQLATSVSYCDNFYFVLLTQRDCMRY